MAKRTLVNSRFGDSGPEVRQLQAALNKAQSEFRLTVDGDYGENTVRAVKALQKAHGLFVDGVCGPQTIELIYSLDARSDSMSPAHGLPLVLQRFKTMGFKVYDRGFFNLNLFGIRKKDGEPDKFDDLMGAAYKDTTGNWCVNYWPATTDCGLFYLHNPSNPSGSAILVENQQCEDVWVKAKHAGKYTALCQRGGKVRVYRDNNKDSTHDYDPETTQEGYFGINLHRSTTNPDNPSERVFRWSAGCQVHSSITGFNQMMDLVDLQIKHTGIKSFTYTLLAEW